MAPKFALSWSLKPLLVLLLAHLVLAQCDVLLNTTGPAYDQDPILQLQPQFAKSLPVQILLSGIVFALVAVLLIHLLFTAQYHWPLAPVNFILQVMGVSSLLISLVATLRVVLATALIDSQKWPYMLTYIAVHIPPKHHHHRHSYWTSGEVAAWYFMNATTSALVQITHIQFLTLLFPSHLEARLILFLLGPLAILSAAMELLPMHDSARIVDLSNLIRNTCNATLSILFTLALCIWGFLVNRNQAWRTDGGTAAFGGGALALAFVSSALNFLYIPTKYQYVWLPGLMWAIVLWQSFLGWWWWVGGGMGVGEVDEMICREEKREKKRRARMTSRAERKGRAQEFLKNASLRLGRHGHVYGHENAHASVKDGIGHGLGMEADAEAEAEVERASIITDTTIVTSPTSSPSRHGSGSGWWTRFEQSTLGSVVCGWFIALRRAHLHAARKQAIEQVERRQQVCKTGPSPNEASGSTGSYEVVGWGLGSFRERDRKRKRGVMDWERDAKMKSMEKLDLSVSEKEDEGGDENENGRLGVYGETNSGTLDRGTNGQVPFGSVTANSTSWSWRGPLQRWRLKDSTVY